MKPVADIQEYAAKHNYVLTPAQVGQLAREFVTAQQTVTAIGGATYLRVVIAGTITEMGLEPRLRASKASMGKLSDEDIAKQVAALEAVTSRYYAAILEAVIDDEIKDHPRLGKEERARRSLERNRRTNYARSAKSTVAAYIRAGFDISTVVVSHATKRSLYEAVQATKPSEAPKPETVAANLETASTRLQEIANTLCEMDAERARTEIEKLLGALTGLLAKTGAKPTDKPADAFNRCVPLITKAGLFWPAGVETRQ